MSESKNTLQVFLCHSRIDRDSVHALYLRLTKDHVKVWLDKEKLLPGHDWKREIQRAILESEVVIICLSKSFNKREGYRYEELKLALKKAHLLPDDEVFIIPVRLEKCDVPESLMHLHRVDLFGRGGYKRLIRALRERVESN